MFSLGQIVWTPGARQVLSSLRVAPHTLLRRHQSGDWGDMCPEDKQANDRAIGEGSRIFSSYVLADAEKVWIITEADRSVTTILLPHEY